MRSSGAQEDLEEGTGSEGWCLQESPHTRLWSVNVCVAIIVAVIQ